uniref:Uncharacterized protein n=1 Tax=Oryza nivara TaxID=4536 RepID=A0A0E0FIF4_ORYNI
MYGWNETDGSSSRNRNRRSKEKYQACFLNGSMSIIQWINVELGYLPWMLPHVQSKNDNDNGGCDGCEAAPRREEKRPRRRPCGRLTATSAPSSSIRSCHRGRWTGQETAAAAEGVGAPQPRRDSAGRELGRAGRGGGQGGSAARESKERTSSTLSGGSIGRSGAMVEGSWEVVRRMDSTVGGLHGLPRQPFPVAAAQLLPRWLPPAPSFFPGGSDVGGRAVPPPDSGLPHRPAALPTAELRSKGREKEEEGGREGRGRRG